MGKTKHAVELAAYLREEARDDGVMIGISDARICATALKIYALARGGAMLMAVVVVPLLAVWGSGFNAHQASGFGQVAALGADESVFEQPASACGETRSAFAAPL